MSLTIKSKMGIGIGLLLGIVGLISATAFVQVLRLERTLTLVSVQEWSENEAASDLQVQAARIIGSINGFMASPDDTHLAEFEECRTAVVTALQAYNDCRDGEGDDEFELEESYYEAMETLFGEFIKTSDRLVGVTEECTLARNAMMGSVDEILTRSETLPAEADAAGLRYSIAMQRYVSQLVREVPIHRDGLGNSDLRFVSDFQQLKVLADQRFGEEQDSPEMAAWQTDLFAFIDECETQAEEWAQVSRQKSAWTAEFNEKKEKLETFLVEKVQANTKREIKEEHAEAVELARQTSLAVLLSLCAALLLAPLVWYQLSGLVIRRTRLLLNGTQQVLAGNLSTRLPQGKDDELGILTRSFNTMTARLETAMENERASRNALETMVEERTRKLTLEIARRQTAEEERKIAEQQLRQAEKMKAVGQLAGGIAHDFNNLLQAILGHTEILRMTDDTNPSLQQILHATKKAAELVKQLLIFSRNQPLRMRAVELNALSEQMLSILASLIGGNIQIETDLQAAPSAIEADPGQIEQILMNLTLNARDAMPQGGTLTIRTENATITTEQASKGDWILPGPCTLLTVKDSGTGIDDRNLEHIFEPFFTTKDVGKGTGLGLATVFGIVQSHHGCISVETEPGQGTAFHIFLPVAKHALSHASDQNPESISGGAETILLSEDEGAVRALTKRVLEYVGYTVLETSTGQQAVECYRKHTQEIDLVLLDVVMPELGGKDAFDQIRAVNPQARVLLCSGYAPESVSLDLSEGSGIEFISKPYESQALLKKIRAILDQ
jgi:signal transduction histidine kinase